MEKMGMLEPGSKEEKQFIEHLAEKVLMGVIPKRF
jgi:hypothetical protein